MKTYNQIKSYATFLFFMDYGDSKTEPFGQKVNQSKERLYQGGQQRKKL